MRKKYIEDKLPRAVKVVLAHFHHGNSSRSARRGHPYMTLCKLYDKNTGSLLSEGHSFCSHKDIPNRKIGRHVAIGRAMKAMEV